MDCPERYRCATLVEKAGGSIVSDNYTYTPFKSRAHAVDDSEWCDYANKIDVTVLPPIVDTPIPSGEEEDSSTSCWTAPEDLPPHLRYVDRSISERPKISPVVIDRSFGDAFTEAFEKYYNSNRLNGSTYITPTPKDRYSEVGLPDNYKVVLTPTPTGVAINLLDLNDPSTYEGFIEDTFKDPGNSPSK